MNRHDAVLRKTYGIQLRTVVDRLIKTFAKATPADIEAGAEWYPLAGECAADFATESGRSKECCAAVIAHLSPRARWVRNILAAHMLLVDKEVMPGAMARSVANATEAISVDDAARAVGVATDLSEALEKTFSRDAKKTRNFWRNILGDPEAVTVDIWALRAARLDEDDRLLQRSGVYEAVEYAHQLAARRVGVTPATFQACCWIVARGGRTD